MKPSPIRAGSIASRVRVGAYKIVAELSGFDNVTRTGVEMLVGQTITLNLQMAPSAAAGNRDRHRRSAADRHHHVEVGGNIDPRQVSELPVAGRQWTALALLAPGNRTNSQGAMPVQDRGDVREFQLNIDGQQVTPNPGTGGQPRYSRDAIAEFQFISNRFDATQGPSSGVQVNAIRKSGTNSRRLGLFVGNFRDSRFNKPLIPCWHKAFLDSDQQYAPGPLAVRSARNKVHFFGNFDYERRPRLSSNLDGCRIPPSTSTLTGKEERQARRASGSTRSSRRRCA